MTQMQSVVNKLGHSDTDVVLWELFSVCYLSFFSLSHFSLLLKHVTEFGNMIRDDHKMSIDDTSVL